MPETPARRSTRWPILAVVATALGMLLTLPEPVSAQPARPTAEVPSPPADQAPGHRILLLYGEPRLTPAIVAQDAILRSVLTDRSSVPVTFYTEYLDLNLFHGTVPLPELRELLRRKYETRHIDLIVTGGSRVLRIALHNRAEFFSNAPIVFLGVDPTAAADLRLDRDVTGTWLHMGWADTLTAARRLQPDIRRVVVVGGASPTDRVWIEGAHRQLSAPGNPTEVVYLIDLSLDEIVAKVRALPKGTVVLVGVFFRDATGRDFSTPEAVTRIAAAASVPVYALTEAAIGTGVVGGHVSSFEAHGRVGAELALQMLAGERPPPTNKGTSVPMFDARQIERWGLDLRRLPAAGVVRFQEPSLWERHRTMALSAFAALLVQGGLIGGLLVQRAQRRRAQQSLAERLRFETLLSDLAARFAASTPVETEGAMQRGLQLIGESLGVDWATVRTLDERGDEARLAQAWTRKGVPSRPAVIRATQTPWIIARLRQDHVVHLTRPADLPDEAAIDRQTLQGIDTGSMVAVPLRGDGTVLGCLVVGTVREGRGWSDLLTGRLRLLAEVFAHALERQRAVDAAQESNAQIRDLAGRLMSAQEEERRRIARDLHDDASQELAALSIALSALGGRLPPDSAPGLREEVARLQARAVALAEGIRHLSHELHPGVLQHVGVAVALRSYCREFARTHGLPVTFQAEGDLESVPADVGLCLYRVVQEALGNVAKHAAAGEAHVTVERVGADVVLAITDDGSGFDQAAARSRRGLGLLSLDERARLVGGRLTIDTKPQRGTELRIVVPIIEVEDAARDRVAG